MSIVVRKSLGRQLKALREVAGKTPSDVALTTLASTSKLHRIETGEVRVRLETVWALCDLYSATVATKQRLSQMALNTSEKGWWEDYSDLMTPRFGTYVELESAATTLLAYDGELVHGLLQTPAYHRAIFALDPDGSPEAVERHVQLRLERQRAAQEKQPRLRMSAVIGEGALMRQVGGRKVMTEQKMHLHALAQERHTDINVLPWSAGAHAAMKGAFNVLQFDTAVHPDVIYIETYAGGRYVEDQDRLSGYLEMFKDVRAVSVPIEEYLR